MVAFGETRTFSVKKAHEAQLRLSKQIILEDRLPDKIHLVAGVDVTYSKCTSIGAVAVLDYDSLTLVESQTALCKTPIPYMPTLLSFREIPPAILTIKRLRTRPDLLLVDGQGFAHPYHCSFASHLGLVMGKPTIGVAKSRLFGEAENVKAEENVAFLRHKDEVVGAVVTTRRRSKPVYASVGHMISLKTAIGIVRKCTCSNRIPEPLLKAHEIATAEKRKIHIQQASNR
jgi:deoxyribonuclease V